MSENLQSLRIQGKARLLLALIWCAMAVGAASLALVARELLVVGLPVGVLSLIAGWRYYRSSVTIEADQLIVRWAAPRKRVLTRTEVARVETETRFLAARPVVWTTSGKRFALEPAAELSQLDVQRHRRHIEGWITQRDTGPPAA